MAIVYYPNRIYKKKVPAIDRTMAKRDLQKVSGSINVLPTPINEVISANDDWQLDSIGFQFGSATARDYRATIIEGRKVVTDLNDSLWFQTNTSLPQNIVLDEDFYTGTQLAAQLQTQLNANTVYTAAGITFTVAYGSASGDFTITPSSGTIAYLDVNTMQTLRTRDSIAGHLFGLTVTTAQAASVTSDANVYGLNSGRDIMSYPADTALTRWFDTVIYLSVDQAVEIHVDSGVSIVVDWAVTYEEII